jgi:hypothetical protein
MATTGRTLDINPHSSVYGPHADMHFSASDWLRCCRKYGDHTLALLALKSMRSLPFL